MEVIATLYHSFIYPMLKNIYDAFSMISIFASSYITHYLLCMTLKPNCQISIESDSKLSDFQLLNLFCMILN